MVTYLVDCQIPLGTVGVTPDAAHGHGNTPLAKGTLPSQSSNKSTSGHGLHRFNTLPTFWLGPRHPRVRDTTWVPNTTMAKATNQKRLGGQNTHASISQRSSSSSFSSPLAFLDFQYSCVAFFLIFLFLDSESPSGPTATSTVFRADTS